MNRNAVRVFACVLCLIFTGFYYVAFNKQFNQNEIVRDVDSIEQSNSFTNEEMEIHWLQLGIFNSREVVDELIARCANINIECHTYTKNNSITAFCNATKDVSSLIEVKQKLEENGIEYYQKSAWITDQNQLEKLSTNTKEAYLEVISSLP